MPIQDYDLNDIVEMKKNIHVINRSIGKLSEWVRIFVSSAWDVGQACYSHVYSLKKIKRIIEKDSKRRNQKNNIIGTM